MSDQLINCSCSNKDNKSQIKYLHIDVTVKCNLKCSYCYYSDYNNKSSISKEIEIEKLRELILESKLLGCTRIIFSGGEVYSSDKFPELLDFCADNELEITLITNATLVSEKNLAQLLRIRKWIHEIKISYDGLNHDIIRGKGNGKKTLDTINEFDECGLPWTMNTILTSLNIEGIFELYEFLKTKNPKAWRIDHPFFQGNYTKNFQYLAIPDFDNLFLRLSSLLKIYLTEKPNFELWMFTIYRPGLENWNFTKQEKHLHPCTYNKRNLAIRGNGELTPCSRFLFPLGDVKKDSIDKIRTDSTTFKDFWNIKIGELKACQSCDYLYSCGGGCRAHAYYETGDLMNSDPIACKIMPLFHKMIIPLFSVETQKCFNDLVISAIKDQNSNVADWKDKPSIYNQMMEEKLHIIE